MTVEDGEQFIVGAVHSEDYGVYRTNTEIRKTKSRLLTSQKKRKKTHPVAGLCVRKT